MLPGHPDFDFVLATSPPPGWQERSPGGWAGNTAVFVADSASGVLRQTDERDFWDYFHGGEYDERLAAIETDPEDGLWDAIDNDGAIFDTDLVLF